ncbi:HAMP domain-containing sensor histidine kinase [Sphingomonas sp. Y38-1Y]|uniref:sensor histidine kinase n=1 Tax=Sphingomonas sp. Y38-1Y TaxID=3078265 RepID=UPI0028E7D65D|nr:HAMP domain-containing sensor histidine kinase [Sphingomonas sp. Y38-1Y]
MRLLPRSLFGRMFALSLLATLAALVVAGFAIGGVLERFVIGGVDARLRDRLVALESAVRDDGSLDRAQLGRVAARLRSGEPWQVVAVAGTVGGGGDLAKIDTPPGHRPPRPFEDEAAPFEGRMRDGTRVHGLSTTVATRTGDVRVLVAVPRSEIDRPVLAALTPLAASLAILGLALGGAALVQLRFGLRPLATLRTAVEAIRRGRASRVPEDVPDELVPLARELNALAADSAAALTGARASAANLAHALKTPVATLSLHVGDDPVARAQLQRIEATLRHHLGRARAVSVDRRATTVLAPALADLVAAIVALHGDRVRVSLDVAEDLAAAIDPQDLDELAGNLIDNAARHAAANVTVSALARDRDVQLAVADDGPGIPAADRDRATAPGIRLDERADGHGFGLAIARELAELYGGTLMLADSPEGGLLATVTLPIAR